MLSRPLQSDSEFSSSRGPFEDRNFFLAVDLLPENKLRGSRDRFRKAFKRPFQGHLYFRNFNFPDFCSKKIENNFSKELVLDRKWFFKKLKNQKNLSPSGQQWDILKWLPSLCNTFEMVWLDLHNSPSYSVSSDLKDQKSPKNP